MSPREQREKTSSQSVAIHKPLVPPRLFVANKDNVKPFVAQWDPARTSQKLTV